MVLGFGFIFCLVLISHPQINHSWLLALGWTSSCVIIEKKHNRASFDTDGRQALVGVNLDLRDCLIGLD